MASDSTLTGYTTPHFYPKYLSDRKELIDNPFAAWRENAPEQTEVGDKIWSKKGQIWK